MALVGKNDLDKAIKAFQSALSADPGVAGARVGLARAYVMDGQIDAAQAQLGEQLKREPKDATAWLSNGNLSLQRSDLQIAEKAFMTARDNAVGQLTRSQKALLLGALTDVQLSVGNLDGARVSQAQLSKLQPDAPVTRILSTRIAMVAKDYPLAVSEAQKALQATPDLPQLKLLLGAALLANGNLNQADVEASDLLRRMPDNASARKLKAQIDAQIKSADASSMAARMAAAQSAVGKGDRATAISQLETICREDARAIDARLALGALYLQSGRKQDADRVLGEATSTAGNNSRINLAVGRVYLEGGDPDEALARFQSVTKADSANPEPMMFMARAYAAKGDAAAARASAQKAVTVAPESVPAATALVALDLREKRIEQARSRVTALRQQFPQEASVLMQEGDVAMASKDFATAAMSYEDAYKRQASPAAALRNYSARSQGKLTDRTHLLEDWVRREPEDAPARFALAVALTESGAEARAIGQFELLARQPTPSAMVLNNLAWLYLESSDSRAEATARQAFDLAPKDARIADTYGWVLLQQGKSELALPLLKQAASVPDSSPAVQYHYAVALARSGQQTEAKQRLQQVVNAQTPESEDARKLLADLGG